ncbi:glycoside hydrolase family 3 N-terminal domain-containing protein [Streptomyces sp. JV176]|uniref:beta-xylosidase/alpha-l-arabinosidase n=1 Tax=Streptomyces sp. JV176 TaxID=858630 RepID=UPI002E7A0E9B|nr:glycoside hydrolase family 3 N-terminal domain-containing protein [Streptomyces sp. JV176]MEE1802789.1 glycoside hydrolase family 3 N-terminal domain-containing protein [Streptomyces sp. JV176]
MTTEEKLAQLYGLWAGASADGAEVAPHQHDMDAPPTLTELLPYGLGQLTRPFGTVPVDPALGALSLMRTQERIAAAHRFGVPAMAHDECLAGFAAWGATTYPVPLSWGASFDPDLVREMAGAIGRDMRSVGLHQGLAPVLDVVRDARWGRVEETIGEDPYLIGTVATAYVRGLESAGVVATLKHFAGYSASRGGRNLAPVGMGARELADVVLPPFEMAVREGGVRSVMSAYNDIDGVPCAADERLLTELLRDTWGFEGTVVADYFGIAFLRTLHGVAGDWAQAATAALTAGVDVELPTVKTFGQPLRDAIADGRLPREAVDRAVRRVLTQKAGLGLLDPEWSARPTALAGADLDSPERLRGTVTLDSPAHRDIARRLAERSVILLRNDGTLPLAGPARIALIGPQAESATAVLGCYSFPVHVGPQHPGVPVGIELPTLREALAAEFPESEIVTVAATGIDGPVPSEGFAAAVRAARAADVVVVALGDRAGLFGRGTSGEGCDAETLDLPGAQGPLLDAVLDAVRGTGTRVVVTLLSGRPYVLGRAVTEAGAIVQAFFPGQEGTPAVAGVLSGRINPSGRLPVSVPRLPGAQPSTYLAAPLARASDVSSIDPTPAFGFGHGLTYTSFTWSELATGEPLPPTDGAAELSFTVTNTGGRAGAEVVQLYLHDPVASVVQPVQRLIGYVRIPLEAGERARVTVTVPADLASFTGRDGRRTVEPGALELRLAASSTDVRLTAALTLTGPVRYVDHTRALHATFAVRTPPDVP